MASHMIMKCRSGAISRINKHIRSPKVVAKAELLTGQPLQFAPILEFVILRSEQQEQVRGFSRITTQTGYPSLSHRSPILFLEWPKARAPYGSNP
jgi:hypothetical protein